MTDRYIDSGAAPGGDGLAPETAWDTLTDIATAGDIFTGGDVIYIKKGSTFQNEQFLNFPSSGTSDSNRILITTYGTGANPIIDPSYVYDNSWTDNEDGTYKRDYGGTSVYTFWEDSIPLRHADDASDLVASPGTWFKPGDGKVWYHPTDNPTGAPSEHEVKVTRYNGGVAVDLLGHDNITIENIKIQWAFTGITSWGWHTTPTAGDGSNNCTIRYCQVEHCYTGVGFGLVDGTASNLRIHGNTTDDVMASIELGCCGGDTPEDSKFDEYYIYDNIVTNGYGGWGADNEGVGVQNGQNGYIYDNYFQGDIKGIFQFTCPGGTTTNNWIYGNYVKSTVTGYTGAPSSAADTKFYGNYVINNIFEDGGTYDYGLTAPYRSGAFLGNTTTAYADYNYLANNTFVGCYYSIGLYTQADSQDLYWKIYNNISKSPTSNGHVCAYRHDMRNWDIDYNLYYPDHDDAFYDSGGYTYNFTEWKALAGPGNPPANRDNSSPAIADPLFVSATDFRLMFGSPAIDVGDTLAYVASDYVMQARPIGTGYDIGAYEYRGWVLSTDYFTVESL